MIRHKFVAESRSIDHSLYHKLTENFILRPMWHWV